MARGRRFGVRVSAAIALLSSLASASPCLAEWRRIDSPNFVVVGDVSARELRDVAVQFETFREALGRMLTQRATTTPVPTVVLVFDNDREFTPFKPRFNGKPIEISGLFVGREDVNYIALVRRRDGGLSVLFHEYAHLIVSNVARNVPAWLNEGLAEYYSTFESVRDGREAHVGRPVQQHVFQLRSTSLLPLAELLRVDRSSPLYNEGQRRSIFYAESWALTHMLLSATPNRRPQLARFLELVGQGTPAADAWPRAFEGDDVEKALRNYIYQHAFQYSKIEFSDKIVRVEAAAVPVKQQDVQTFLADFLLRQRRTDEAAERLRAAERLDPSDARLRAVQAHLAVQQGDYDGAAAQLRDIGTPGDWLVAYYIGTALANIGERGGRADQTLAARVRAQFDVVQLQRGELAHALARMSALAMRMPEDPTAETRGWIERARSLAPGRIDYAFLHAGILARLGDFAAARSVLGPLMSPAYPPDVRDAARSNMTFVVEREERAKARGGREGGSR